MLIQAPQPKYFEKVFARKDGVLLRVRFAAVLIDGKIFGRILSVETIGQTLQLSPVRAPAQPPAVAAANPQPAHSPYFSFDFFVSQMTRAPSL